MATPRSQCGSEHLFVPFDPIGGTQLLVLTRFRQTMMSAIVAMVERRGQVFALTITAPC